MHNSKRVISLDYSNLSGEEYLRCVEQSLSEAKEHSGFTSRLILVDITGSVMDTEVLKAIKRMTSEISGEISSVALFPVSGIQSVFMRAIAAFSKMNIKPFSDKQSALDWLTK